MFNLLLEKCAWERRKSAFKCAVRRDEAYYGDPGTDYTYSRNLNLPKVGYNTALCNLYRNGNSSVGLHTDAEPEMGPVIASVSLGAERLFRLKKPDGGSGGS